MNRIALICAIVLALTVSSCYETTTGYVLNPDGSGKVTVEVKSPGAGLGDTKDPAAGLAKDVLKKSVGVETWKDIEFKVLDDGKSYFKGTAYFKDLNKVKFKDFAMTDSIAFTNDGKTITVQLVDKSSGKSSSGLTVNNEDKKNLSPEQLSQAVKEQKAGYQQIKPMLSAILGTMKTDMSFQFTGKPEKTSNFKVDQGRIALTMVGSKYLDALEHLMNNEEWLKKQALAGTDIKKDAPGGDELNQILFGEKGPVKATYKAKMAASFDYAKESEAAAAGYDAMLAKLGLDKETASGAKESPPIASYKGGNFKNVRIARVQWSDMEDPDYSLFGHDQSYQVTFIGELPGAIMKVDKVALTKAISASGDDLLPEDEWSRETTWADLSKGKNFVKWSFTLKRADLSSKGLGEIAGSLYCQVAQKTKVVDLGFKKLETGSAGTALNASMEEMTVSDYQTELRIRVAVSSEMIKDVKAVGADGKPIVATNSYASSTSDTETVWSLSFEKPLPAKAKIQIELNDAVENYAIPFSIKNVDWFGRAIK